MNHGYFQDRLSAYFDQALTLEEMRAVKEHLSDCAECRGRLDDLAKLDQLIEEKRDLGESDYWEKAAQKIESKLTAAEDNKVTDVRSGWFGLGWKLAATAASITVLTFVALHEDEIQDIADRSGESSDMTTAPAPMHDVQPKPDTAGEQALGYFRTDALMDESELALESPSEPTSGTAPPPEPAEEPSAKLVPLGTEVAKELEGKAAAEEAWQVEDAKRIPTEKPDQHYQNSVPVTSVTELLKKVAGVIVTKEGDTVIRGGGQHNVAYIVDGVPIGDPLGGLAEDTEAMEVVVDLGTIALERKRTDIGNTITVTAQRDIIDKFEVSNQATITKEQLLTDIDTPTLEDLRAKFQYLETDTSMKSRIMRQPVTSVEELLEQVEGVVTNKDGEIFISGSSKAKYVIIKDGSSALDGLGNVGANLSLPPRPADSLGPEQKLAWWRTRRDSFQQIIESPQESTFNRTQKSAAAPDGIADTPVPPARVSESTKPPNGTQIIQYLKACYMIAAMTDSVDEYDSAWFAIAKYADDDASPLCESARHYLLRLALIEKQRQDQE